MRFKAFSPASNVPAEENEVGLSRFSCYTRHATAKERPISHTKLLHLVGYLSAPDPGRRPRLASWKVGIPCLYRNMPVLTFSGTNGAITHRLAECCQTERARLAVGYHHGPRSRLPTTIILTVTLQQRLTQWETATQFISRVHPSLQLLACSKRVRLFFTTSK